MSTSEQGKPTQQQPLTILDTPDRGLPLRKLISGFCDPFISKHDDERTRNALDDSRHLHHQATAAVATTATIASPSSVTLLPATNQSRSDYFPSSNGESVTHELTFEELEDTTTTTMDSDLLVSPAPDPKAAPTVSEFTIDSNDGISNETFLNVEKEAEIEVSLTLVGKHRYYAQQVFFAGFLLLLTTLLTLQKLGYISITDFHTTTKSLLTSSSSSSSSLWFEDDVVANTGETQRIHLFDKTQASLDRNVNQTLDIAETPCNQDTLSDAEKESVSPQASTTTPKDDMTTNEQGENLYNHTSQQSCGSSEDDTEKAPTGEYGNQEVCLLEETVA